MVITMGCCPCISSFSTTHLGGVLCLVFRTHITRCCVICAQQKPSSDLQCSEGIVDHMKALVKHIRTQHLVMCVQEAEDWPAGGMLKYS